MVCSRTRRGTRLPLAVRLLLAAIGCAACLGSTSLPGRAEGTWWQLRGFAGVSVLAVSVDGNALRVETAAGWQVSVDDGNTWNPSGPSSPTAPPGSWVVAGGRPAIVSSGGPAVDPSGPELGAARGITNPAASPGAVVAVAADSTVWRRGADGKWARALLLLPSGGWNPAPDVTAVASFTDQPLSQAIYVATAGYGVLITTDGGIDWSRADSGIPGVVNALAADSGDATVWAATSDGLYAHKLRALPAPPAYLDEQLWWRIAGIGLVVVVAVLGGLIALLRLSPRTSATA